MLCHIFAVEQIMRTVAVRLGRDESLWALAALVHDLDIELQEFDFSRHGHKTKELLAEVGFDNDFIEAVVLHNESAWEGKARTTELQWALASVDRITWLVYAVMRAQPDGSLATVTADLVLRRFHEHDFARSLDRSTIMECLHLGFSLEEFVSISLDAMKHGCVDYC